MLGEQRVDMRTAEGYSQDCSNLEAPPIQSGNRDVPLQEQAQCGRGQCNSSELQPGGLGGKRLAHARPQHPVVNRGPVQMVPSEIGSVSLVH